MGINFEQTTHGKIGEIIYPTHNGTNGFWEKTRWDVIVEVDSKGLIIDKRYVYDFATIKAIELIREFPKIIHNLNQEGNGE